MTFDLGKLLGEKKADDQKTKTMKIAEEILTLLNGKELMTVGESMMILDICKNSLLKVVNEYANGTFLNHIPQLKENK